MPQIMSIQRREPYSHSAASYSDYNYLVAADEFAVKRVGDKINIFFPRSPAPGQGVGLLLPSLEVGIAVGRTLLTVAEGYSSEMVGRM